MSYGIAKVRCWKVEESLLAIRVSRVPRDRNPESKDLVWIPRSPLEHISTYGPTPEGAWPELLITMPESLADRKGLL